MKAFVYQPSTTEVSYSYPDIFVALPPLPQVPREVLMFVIRSFGGKVTWEGEEAPVDEGDSSITHQVGLRGGEGGGREEFVSLTTESVSDWWCFLHLSLL